MFSFHPEAENEFLDAIEYYEMREDGLGRDFSREVYRAIELVVEFPEAWSEYTLGTRRYLTNRFPYSLVYDIRRDKIFIWAVMHLNREPGYWTRRIN
jgi:plasmid stabilization system protein ParE